MLLHRVVPWAFLIVVGCVSVWAQDASQPFDSSRYSLVVPAQRPATPPRIVLRPNTQLPVTSPVAPVVKPCAAVRLMRPGSGTDPKMIPFAPRPIEPNTKDLTEDSVPAPSCADRAATQLRVLPRGLRQAPPPPPSAPPPSDQAVPEAR